MPITVERVFKSQEYLLGNKNWRVFVPNWRICHEHQELIDEWRSCFFKQSIFWYLDRTKGSDRINRYVSRFNQCRFLLTGILEQFGAIIMANGSLPALLNIFRMDLFMLCRKAVKGSQFKHLIQSKVNQISNKEIN